MNQKCDRAEELSSREKGRVPTKVEAIELQCNEIINEENGHGCGFNELQALMASSFAHSKSDSKFLQMKNPNKSGEEKEMRRQ